MSISLPDAQLLAEKKKIWNWIIPSIIAVLLLFFITGIPALVYAVISRFKLRKNDIAGARKTANIARTLTLISVVLGIIFFIVEKMYKHKTGKDFDYLWFLYTHP